MAATENEYAVVTACAYQGLRSYAFIGAGWILHKGWGVLHHLHGPPIIGAVPSGGSFAEKARSL
jgi:hypothetical protein